MNSLEDEQDVLKFWKEIDAFKTSLELSKESEPFVFFDGKFFHNLIVSSNASIASIVLKLFLGPPFATGRRNSISLKKN